MMLNIWVNGDFKGDKTEKIVNNVLENDSTMTLLEGTKYHGENGLDHVAQHIDPDTGKTMTLVIDSKQLAKNGTTSLNPEAAGGALQLSDASLRITAQRLGNSPAGLAVRQELDEGSLVKAVTFVDKNDGKLKIMKIQTPVVGQ